MGDTALAGAVEQDAVPPASGVTHGAQRRVGALRARLSSSVPQARLRADLVHPRGHLHHRRGDVRPRHDALLPRPAFRAAAHHRDWRAHALRPVSRANDRGAPRLRRSVQHDRATADQRGEPRALISSSRKDAATVDDERLTCHMRAAHEAEVVLGDVGGFADSPDRELGQANSGTAGVAAESSLLVALLFAIGTSALSTASRALWQHGPSMLFLAGALLCLVRADTSSRWLAPAGVCLALGYLMRPTNSISVLLLSGYVLISRARTRSKCSLKESAISS